MTDTPVLARNHVSNQQGDEPFRITAQAQLVDRRLVHKRSAAEVLLDHVMVDGPTAASFGIRVARSHSSNRNHSGAVPLIAGLEVMRQLGLAIGHLCAQVPLEWAYTLQRAAFAWHDETPAFTPQGTFDADARVNIHDIEERRGLVSRLRASAEVRHAGRLVATGSGEFRCLPPDVYRLLRRRAAGNASLTDRTAEPQILTETMHADRRVSGVLGWPLEDAFLFDHDIDHVPGMLFAQAGISAHHVLRGSREPSSIRITCDRFAEIAQDVTVDAANEGTRVLTTLRQAGQGVGQVITDELAAR